MSIYQHFRKEEQPFIDQVLSWQNRVESVYEVRLTDFLDPREQEIIRAVIGTNHDIVQFQFFGGNEHCERKRAIIAPFYEEITDDCFEMVVMEATYQTKFVQLTHPDVMGAFLSMGIERRKLGDIIVGDGLIQFVTAKDIAPYVLANLTSIKNTTVKLKECKFDTLAVDKVEWIEHHKTVSSLRLDAVIAEIYNISRKLATEAVQKRFVKVNFKTVDDGKFLLEAGDLISVRGKGRSKLLEIHGKTRKDRQRITIGILT